MGTKDTVEACGRCAMTSVTGMIGEDEESTADGPFDGDRIELSDAELRRVSPHVVALGRVKRRLDELVTKLTYGR